MSDQLQDSDTNDEEEQITIGKIVETDTTYKLSVPIEKPKESEEDSD